MRDVGTARIYERDEVFQRLATIESEEKNYCNKDILRFAIMMLSRDKFDEAYVMKSELEDTE